MEISVKQLFELFVHHFGHRVIRTKQEDWSTSMEGWEHHALLHMMYWTLRDFRNLSHTEAWRVATSDQSELSERLLSELFEVLKSSREDHNTEDVEVETSVG